MSPPDILQEGAEFISYNTTVLLAIAIHGKDRADELVKHVSACQMTYTSKRVTSLLMAIMLNKEPYKCFKQKMAQAGL